MHLLGAVNTAEAYRARSRRPDVLGPRGSLGSRSSIGLLRHHGQRAEQADESVCPVRPFGQHFQSGPEREVCLEGKWACPERDTIFMEGPAGLDRISLASYRVESKLNSAEL